MKTRTFIDSAPLDAAAGNGGDGCASFRREKFVPRGGPDGGDGGHGGSVILLADRDTTSLIGIHFAPHRRAENGGHGSGRQRHGRNGADVVVKVPPGTVVHDLETRAVLWELVEHGQSRCVARGGRGGRGNVHWKSPTHRAPREFTTGDAGETRAFALELKLVADVGLVGFPNAGKSSLLARITDAHPKVGAYPFTTLNPIIGTVMYEDYRRLTVADIPGIITDAHRGVGLGYAFLRHIERARGLVFVIDMSGMEQRAPHDDYANLRAELARYRADLIDRPHIVVANKMDLPDAEEHYAAFVAAVGERPLRFSAATGAGAAALKQAIARLTPVSPPDTEGTAERKAPE